MKNELNIPPNFERLVLGCIDADLQVNTRWKALGEIYKIYMLLHRSDLNISEFFRQIVSHFLAKFAKFIIFEFFSLIFA